MFTKTNSYVPIAVEITRGLKVNESHYSLKTKGQRLRRQNSFSIVGMRRVFLPHYYLPSDVKLVASYTDVQTTYFTEHV